MDNIFVKGEYVLYGKTGVCLIDDVKPLEFSDAGSGKLYYILKPVGTKGSTVYIPADNRNLTSKMHRLMTKSEIDNLLLNTKGKEIKWIEPKTLRAYRFNEIISEGDRQKLVMLVRCIYLKKSEKQREKKRLSSADDNILKTAEKLINEEFSHALSCDEEHVGTYIRQKLGIES